MSPSTVVTRIAPSPTGDPHVGTAYIGLFNAILARQNGGRFILRIEDTDQTRYVASSEARIFDSMRWLDLSPDESSEKGGENGPYCQSKRLSIYQQHAEMLAASGHAYWAFETPEELAELREASGGKVISIPSRDLDPAEAQRRRAAGEGATLRLKVPREGETVVNDIFRKPITIQNSEIDDKVLLKADGFPTYHLANVVDDHLMQVSHVIRAEEWITSTPIHILLYRAFGWNEPAFGHMPLLRNADRSKISKRKNPTSLEWYKEAGYLPEALLNFLATMGWSHPEGREIFDLDEFARVFKLEDVSLGEPIFNLDKLRWYNAEYLRNVLSAEEVLRRVKDFHGGTLPWGDDAYALAVLQVMLPRMEVLGDFVEKTAYFWNEDFVIEEKAAQAIQNGKDQLPAAIEALEAVQNWEAAEIKAALQEKAAALEIKLGKLMPPVRAAVAGTMTSPDLDQMLAAMGKDRTLRRLRAAL